MSGTSHGPLIKRLEQTRAAVLFVQEHHLDDTSMLVRAAARCGFKPALSPAMPTGAGGTSGGVGIFVKAHLGLDQVSSLDGVSAWTVDGTNNRASIAILRSGIRGGLLLISLYLHTSQCVTSEGNW